MFLEVKKNLRAPLCTEISLAACALCAMIQGRSLSSIFCRSLEEKLCAGVLAADTIEENLSVNSFLKFFYKLPPSSRSAVRDMTFSACRRLGLLRNIASQINRTSPSPELAALQFIALDQIIEENPLRSVWVVVHQSVIAAQKNFKYAAGFLNATLRYFLRRRKELLNESEKSLTACWNFPEWWIYLLKSQYPQLWRDILIRAALPAPMTIRVHPSQNILSYSNIVLDSTGVASHPISWAPQSLVLSKALPVDLLPEWRNGAVSVQDSAAQMAAVFLAPKPGERVLDACCAPGGKTTHLLELADCRVTALDISSERMRLVHENLSRLRKNAQVIVADARYPKHWWDGVAYDKILVDAPCSGSGVVCRNPDIRWHKKPEDLTNLALLQHQILKALWPLLKEGGYLLFSTCSIFKEEGSDVVCSFLKEIQDATLIKLSKEFMFDRNQKLEKVCFEKNIWNNVSFDETSYKDVSPSGGASCQFLPLSVEQSSYHDGFFYALLEKNKAI